MEFDVNRAIKYFQDVVTNHYTDFNGRVSRKDYWTYIAVYVVVAVVAGVIERIVGFGLLSILQILFLLPNAGLTARRLQDTGKPGTLVWLLMVPVLILNVVNFLFSMTFGFFGLILIFLPLIPVIGLVALAAAIYMIYLCIQPGNSGTNQYGPQPASVT